jgi:group I intron endonuclease
MKSITNSLNGKSGIYCIINIKNQKRYIGSSKNLQTRLLKHRSLLRHNKHENARLQNGWNKYGEDNFDYYILEFCNGEDNLCKREQFYIDELKPEYNFTLKVERNILSKESRIKQSKTRKELFQKGLLKPNHCCEIHQYDLNGNYIRSFYSIREACRKTGLVPSSINRCLNNTYKKAGKYMWSYTKYNQIEPYNVNKRSFNVKVFDITTNTTQIFDTLASCKKFFNVKCLNIKFYIATKNIYRKRYMFQYILPSNQVID